MGQAIPRQQPAVVLRSHFNKMRALLAVAFIAVAGLTVAVVILANDSDESAGTASGPPIGSINYGGSNSVNPSTGYPTVPFSELANPLAPPITGTRYDGGPEEGTRGAVRAPQATVTPETEMKDEAGTAAAIGQATGSSERSAGEGSQYGTSQYRFAQPQPETQADELSGSKTDPRGPASLLP
jgi:hypothetical protein